MSGAAALVRRRPVEWEYAGAVAYPSCTSSDRPAREAGRHAEDQAGPRIAAGRSAATWSASRARSRPGRAPPSRRTARARWPARSGRRAAAAPPGRASRPSPPHARAPTAFERSPPTSRRARSSFGRSRQARAPPSASRARGLVVELQRALGIEVIGAVEELDEGLGPLLQARHGGERASARSAGAKVRPRPRGGPISGRITSSAATSSSSAVWRM